uniref:Candidate secreted effector n=1 Tax=Meloidogyne incognita TaxID=6306 RepID=A0A914MHJ0_MELIC
MFLLLFVSFLLFNYLTVEGVEDKMSEVDLKNLENFLNKRWSYEYRWGNAANNGQSSCCGCSTCSSGYNPNGNSGHSYQYSWSNN